MQTIEEVKEHCRFVSQGIVDAVATFPFPIPQIWYNSGLEEDYCLGGGCCRLLVGCLCAFAQFTNPLRRVRGFLFPPNDIGRFSIRLCAYRA